MRVMWAIFGSIWLGAIAACAILGFGPALKANVPGLLFFTIGGIFCLTMALAPKDGA